MREMVPMLLDAPEFVTAGWAIEPVIRMGRDLQKDFEPLEDPMSQLVTVKEAAAQLSCSEAAIRKWIYQRRLRPVKVGRLTRLRLDDIKHVASSGLAPVGR